MSDKPNPWTTSAPLSAALPSAPPQGPPPRSLLESQRPASEAGAARADELARDELHALVGPGTAFHGTLSFYGQVRIDGEFSGQILGGRILVIGEGAKVQGELRATRVIVLGGNVRADITATEAIEIYVPAHVTGDLHAPEVHMDRGVRFVGTCDLSELANNVLPR